MSEGIGSFGHRAIEPFGHRVIWLSGHLLIWRFSDFVVVPVGESGPRRGPMSLAVGETHGKDAPRRRLCSARRCYAKAASSRRTPRCFAQLSSCYIAGNLEIPGTPP